MKRQRHGLSITILAATLLCSVNFGANALGQTPAKGQAKTIVLGMVSEIHQKEIEEHFREFARYVAGRLSTASDIEGKVIVAPTLIELAKLLGEKKVDFYMESPYPTYIINDVHGAGRLLLRRWKGGMAEYRSLIFAKKSDGIRRLDDLRGKIIAFEDPGSSSGYFLPKFFLSRRGFKLAEKNSPQTNVSKKEVGYIFAHSQENLIDLVLTQQVSAGAFSDDDYAKLDESKRSELVILAQTELLPRHFVSVRKDLAPALALRLEDILVSMDQNDEGRRILQRVDDTTKFDVLPGGAEMVRRRLLDTFRSR